MNRNQGADLDRRLARDPIAIVGLSALYPKSANLREFWGNVMSAADCIEEVPAGHWDVDEHYDPDPHAPDKTYAKRGGFMPTVPFSPLEFGLPPNILEVTDVLQLLSLVVARDVLKDAGAAQSWYDPSRTGVVLGITGANQLTQPLSARLQTPVIKEVVRSCGLSERDAEEIAEKFKLAFAPWEENSFPGMLGNVVAGRIANRLDLGGTNMTIDAACASSLGALKASVSELLEGRADTMLTGGCDAENTIFMYMCFSKTPAFSKTGRIRPFDQNADGTLIGEGIGMLALRRLADAERDGNRIYAVLRGLGSSSDGRFKSIYAPRKEGQTVALRRAYEDADCSPSSVELFEAHGTGTAVGDATELSALAEVVGASTEQRQYAAVGSVKSQIGHTKAAAGAAGLIKLSMALHQRVLPPTINVDAPNPAIDFVNSPFYVNTVSRPWIRDPERPQRRAAISSFGFGGTNFHCVLEEYGDDSTVQTVAPVAAVHVWHAPDTAALEALLASGAPAAQDTAPPGHARIALAAHGQSEVEELRALALDGLRARPDAPHWTHPKGVYFRAKGADPGKIGALFAGQGSQYVDAGRTAVMALPPLRTAFDQANQHFQGTETLSRVAFPAPAFTDAERQTQEESLRRTEYAQPAIGALSMGQYRYLRELGFAADGFLGHSFGELTALWAADAVDDATFLSLARARGAAMAPPDTEGFDAGAMVAVTATESATLALMAGIEDLAVCNRNAPEQTVVGGSTESVIRLLAAAEAAGVRAKRLPVSAAFHTPFVAHALEAFRAKVENAEIRAPRGPVFANTPGASYSESVEANRRVLAEQLVNPVAFADRVEEMYQAGFRTFVEFGPRGVLTRLVRDILGDREHTVLSLDAGPNQDADLALKRAVAQLAVLGLPLATADRYTAAVPVEKPVKGMTIPLNGINYVSDARKAKYRDALDNGYRVVLPSPVAPASVPVPAGVGARAAESGLPALPAPPPPAPVAPAPVSVAAPVPAAVASSAGPASAPAPRTPAVAAPSADLSDRLTVTEETPFARPAAPVTPTRLDGLVADHLSLHDQYLNGQLDSVRQLTELLTQAAGQGLVNEVLPGVSAVKEHGLAIGRTHLRANEILRELAGFEYGAAPAAPFPAAPAAPIAPAAFVPPQPAVIPPYVPAPPAALPAAPSAPVTPALELPAAPAALAPAPLPAPAATPALAPAPAAPAAAAPASGGGASMDAAAVQAALLEVVSEKTGYPTDMLDLGMDIEADLGIDSIKRVEIMGSLQERFPTQSHAGPEALAELRTLNDITTFISSQTSTAVAAAPVAAVPVAASVSVDAAAVQAALLEVVSEKTGYPTDMLDLGMDIEADLGIDSIKRVEIMGSLQERFPTASHAGPEALAELRTLNDITSFISNRTETAPVNGTAPGAPDTTAAPDSDADATGIGRRQAVLMPLPEPDRLVGAFPEGSTALLVDDGGDLVPPLAGRLAAEGWQVSVLRLPEVAERPMGVEGIEDNALSGWGSAELATRVKEITDRKPRLVLLPATRQDLDWREGVRRLAHGLLIAKHVVEPLREAAATGRTAFLTVTALDGAFGLRGVAEALAPAGGYGGLVKTLAVEAPEVFCRGVDLAPGLDPADAAALVTAELHDAAAGPVQVARDGVGRATLSLAETPYAERAGHEGTLPSEPTADDLLVVTGGGRGITASCVVDLAGRYHTGLLLLGRTPLKEEPDWAAGLYGPADLKAAAVGHLRERREKPVPKRVEHLYQSVVAVREIRQTLEQIHAAGGTAEYLAVDITDAAAVKAALAPYAARVTGLVHGAGVLADQLIEQKKAAEIERVFAPKLDGLRAVVQALPEERLRHVLLFSSVAGFFGNRGQSDYAMANEVLNAWASSFKLRHPDSRVTSVNWGAWDSGMVSPQIKEVFAERGIALIGARTGPRLFTEQFAADRGGDVVTVLGPTTPLSSRPVMVPATPVVVERELAAVADTPLVTDHVIGDTPVLPAALALGWAIGAVERITGASVGRVRDFSVLKGVVLGEDEDERLRLRAQATADGSGAEVLIESADGQGATRPRYSAKLDLTAAGSDRPLVTGLPALGAGRDAAGLYQDGTLFHGPALRGIRKVAAEDGTRLVLECELAEPTASGGAFSGAAYGPGTADLLLQAALVWTRLHRNTASLPLAVAEAELYEALPDGGPFLAVVEPVDPAADPNSPITRLTVTACAPDGRVLARFAGVSVAAAPQLAAKFVNS